MLARTTKPVTVLLAALAVVAVNHVAAQATVAQHTARDATVPTDGSRAVSFQRWATITKIPGGYYYDAGQQDSTLVITRVSGGVRFHDTHTDVIRSKPDSCRKKNADRGVADTAVEGVPPGIRQAEELEATRGAPMRPPCRCPSG